MNKNEFISTLKFELEKRRVVDIDEIIIDFEEHFSSHLEEGLTEAEIVRKVGVPEDIAEDYASHYSIKTNPNSLLVRFGLISSDIGAVILFTLLSLSVIVLGVFSFALMTLSMSLVSHFNFLGLIPSMPYISSLIFGLSIISLAVIASLGTFHIFLYIKQWGKIYLRWRKNMLHNNIYPMFGKHPKLSKRISSKLKFINIVASITFILMFITGYLISSIIAKSFEFWHIWNWFI